jgi:endo-1,4-beta-xylanase
MKSALPVTVDALSLVFFSLIVGMGNVGRAQVEPGLGQLADLLGIKVGFEISPENLQDPAFRQTLKREATVGTMTAYWHLPDGQGMDRGQARNPKNQEILGAYEFTRPKLVRDFSKQNGIEIHGHPLIWVNDRFTPPWVLKVSSDKAISVLRNHIWNVVSEFRGTVKVWHVVNEAFDYEGKLADSYWNRVLGLPSPKAITPRFVNIAFQAAANADPNAQLIYNDYGQEELDSRKYNAIVSMLVNMRIRGIPIHGLGWQLHLNVDQVLDPDFPLEERLNTVAQLGFDNYITELDIVMDRRNPDGTLPPPKSFYEFEDFLRQAAAYQKIAAIFSRAERCVSMQFWGVSDKQSWLGAARRPLLFDEAFRKKLAYEAVRSVFSGEAR